jgi:hypothetical protein
MSSTYRKAASRLHNAEISLSKLMGSPSMAQGMDENRRDIAAHRYMRHGQYSEKELSEQNTK